MLQHKKMLELPHLLEQIKKLKAENKKIVFTNGCYDILHVGHVDLLARARALGDILILGLNTDDSVKRQNKAPNRPINTYEARAYVLSHLESIDFVVSFDSDTPYDLIAEIKPDILVKGGDWPVEKIVGHDIVLAAGGQVHSLDLIQGYSTTNTISRISHS